MAYSPSNPFAPTSAPVKTSTAPITVKSSGVPSPQPNQKTLTTFSPTNPFASGGGTAPTNTSVPPANTNTPPPVVNQPKAPIQQHKETYLESLKRNFPAFIQGFISPFTAIPTAAKETAKVANFIWQTGQAGIALAGSTAGGTIGGFTGKDNLYKEYRREGATPWQAVNKTIGDIVDLQKTAVKNVYTNPEENIRPLAEQAVRKAVKPKATLLDKIIGYGTAAGLKGSELMGNVFNLPVLDSLLSARVTKVGEPTYITPNDIVPSGVDPSKIQWTRGVARVPNPFAGDEYLRFTRLNSGQLRVDTFQVSASPMSKLIGGMFENKTPNIIEGQATVVPQPSNISPELQKAVNPGDIQSEIVASTTPGKQYEGFPKDMLYKPDGSLQPPLATGRIDDIAEKLDVAFPGKSMGEKFRSTVDADHVPSFDFLKQKALDVLKGGASVTPTPIPNPTSIEPAAGTAITALKTTPDAVQTSPEAQNAPSLPTNPVTGKPIEIPQNQAASPIPAPISTESATPADKALIAHTPADVTPQTEAQQPIVTEGQPVENIQLYHGDNQIGDVVEETKTFQRVLTTTGNQFDIVKMLAAAGDTKAASLMPSGTATRGDYQAVDNYLASRYGDQYDAIEILNHDRPAIGVEYFDLNNRKFYAVNHATAKSYSMQSRDAKYPSEQGLNIQALGRMKTVSPSSTKPAIREAVQPAARLITRRIDVLLRKQIKDEARGAKIGFQAGKTIGKAEIKQLHDEQVAAMDKAKGLLLERINEELPVSLRGKFVSQLAHDITAGEGRKINRSITNVKFRLQDRQMNTRIKKLSELPMNAVAVDYQKAIHGLLDSLDFKNPTTRTTKQLTALQNVLKADPKMALAHPELQRLITRLEKTPLAKMTPTDKNRLEQEVNRLYALGKVKYNLKLLFNEREMKIAREKLAASTSKLTPTENTLRLDARKKIIETHFTPRWARQFDGYKENGEHMKMIKDAARRENLYHDQVNVAEQALVEAIQKNFGKSDVVSDESQTKMAIVSAMEQGNYLSAKKTLDTKPIKGIEKPEDIKLTDAERGLLDWMRKYIADTYTTDVAAMAELRTNKPFVRVDNYLPIKYDNELSGDVVDEKMLEQPRFRRTTTKKGFTIERQQGVNKVLRTDIAHVFLEHVHDASWYLQMTPFLEKAKALVNSDEYSAAADPSQIQTWNDYIDILARRGYSKDYGRSAWLKHMRTSLTHAVLGYKLTSIVSQPYALFNAMAYVQSYMPAKTGPLVLKEFMKAWLKPGYSGKVIAESSALTHRQGGELALTEMVEDISQTKKWYAKAAKAFTNNAMSLLQKADVKTAAGVQVAVEKVLKEQGVENPHQEAEFIMNLVSASADISLRPMTLSKGEINKTIFHFQSFALNLWDTAWEDLFVGRVLKGNWKQKMLGMYGLLLLVAGYVAEQETRKGLKKLMGQKGQSTSATMLALTALPSYIPLVGSAISSVASGFDPNLDFPVLTTLETMAKGLSSTITAKKTETKIKGGAKAAESLIELFANIPGSGQAFDFLNSIAFPSTQTSSTSSSGYSKSNPFIIP